MDVTRALETRIEVRRYADEPVAEETKRDFVRRGFLSGLRPVHDRVEYRSRRVGERKLLQVYCGGRGMLLFVDPDEPEKPLVRTMTELLSV